jgi:hypothetical protein
VAPYTQQPAEAGGFAATRTRMEEMLAHLSEPVMMSCTQEALEEYVTAAGRELLRQMMQDQLDARARAEPRLRNLFGADRVVRRRAEPGHRRHLATTVGVVEVERIAYRAPGAGNLHPTDAVLSLPAQRWSHPLQRTVAHEAARGAAREAAASVARATGQQLGTRQVMECAVRAAADIRGFYQATPPAPAVAGDLLVLSVDATGVAMIERDLREATRAAAKAGAEQRAGTAAGQAPSAQLSRRDRGGRTRMATVTAVYDAAPAERSAADVLPADRREREQRRPGPKARGRQVDASLERSTAQMVTAMFDTAHRRDPDHRRRWIVLVDGANHQLDCIEKEAAARGVHIDIIVDFVHVIEYLWRAADELHPARPDRTAWVAQAARAVLEGKSARIVHDIRAAVRATGHTEGDLPAAARTASYLEAKLPYLAYHLALALGWPIASGVIEGSCRHLVKDRMDIAGARWGLASAEAVLLLRTVIDNGDFDDYWRHHVQLDHQREHVSRYQAAFDLAS